jgi:hypothetical protein
MSENIIFLKPLSDSIPIRCIDLILRLLTASFVNYAHPILIPLSAVYVYYSNTVAKRGNYFIDNVLHILLLNAKLGCT